MSFSRIALSALLLGSVTTFVACSAIKSDEPTKARGPLGLVPDWVTAGFDAPESVILSASGDFYYVSNVNGGGSDKDGNGYISKLGLDGKIVDKNFVSGMNGPKGLALASGKLYATDIDRLVIIDAASGSVLQEIAVDGAGFLNDAAATDAGILFSDSANARIYCLKDNKVTVWLEDPMLSGVNGLQQKGTTLLVTTMTDGHLLAVDMTTKQLSQIATGMKNADGIGVRSDGSYIISSWPGKLYHVKTDGSYSTLLDTEAEPVYMNDILLIGDDTLIAPNWQPGTLRTFEVK